MESLKSRLQKGDTLIGIIGKPGDNDRDRFQKRLEKGPYDFISIDGQHSPFTEPDLVSMCQLAVEFSLPVVFRIMHTRQIYMIGKYLDLGPGGIEVPQVNTSGEAIDAVRNFYYPPIGKRSFGGSNRLRLGIDDFSDRVGYAQWWNDAGMLWLQVESIQAVKDSLSLARQGVDCLSFGPNDLLFDMESQPQPDFKWKTVDDCVRHVVAELSGTDTVVCFRHFDFELRQKYLDMGVRILLERPSA